MVIGARCGDETSDGVIGVYAYGGGCCEEEESDRGSIVCNGVFMSSSCAYDAPMITKVNEAVWRPPD
jgi:hypothetical protein